MKVRLFMPLVALILFCPVAVLAAGSDSLEELSRNIEHLIHFVESSDVTFIRNGEFHDSQTAAAHIRAKYARFKNDIRTPEEFIEKCAAKSLISGEDYLVILSDGTKKRASDWLMEELRYSRGESAR